MPAFTEALDEPHESNFSLSIKIIDGADYVCSHLRKGLFWQYKLGMLSSVGLSESSRY